MRKNTPYQPPLFDMDALMEECAREAVKRTAWHGAPLHYTTDYYTPQDLADAFDRYIAENGNFGCVPRSHMWRYSTRIGEAPAAHVVRDGHELWRFDADGSCDQRDHHHEDGDLPGRYMYQAICPPCGWHAIGGETEVAEAWHDHAMPGWRDLPMIPAKISAMSDEKRRRLALDTWLLTHYPLAWQREGSPIFTARKNGGMRAYQVGYPYNGYNFGREV